MNDHVETWLDPYLDGELNRLQQGRVDKHLAQCPECRKLLAQRRALTNLLQEMAPASELKPVDQFVNEVNLRLVRRSRAAQRQISLSLGWQFIPVVLLLAWAFVLTLSIMSNLLLIIPEAEQIVQQSGSSIISISRLSTLLGSYPLDLTLGALKQIGIFRALDWNLITSLIALASIGLLYLGWLAGWWAHSLKE